MRGSLRPNAGTVLGVLALVVAMAGTSIAATQIGKNDVGARELGKVTERSKTFPSNTKQTAYSEGTVPCRSGEELLGGGATITTSLGIDSGDQLAESGPAAGNRWYARANVGSAPTGKLKVTAICLAR